MLDLIALIAVWISIGTLTLLVLSRNYSDRTNRLFAVLTLTGLLWSTFNYATNHVSGYTTQVIVNRISFIAGFLIIVAMWYFSLYFPAKVREHTLQRRIGLAITTIVAILSFTPYFVQSVVYVPKKNLTEVNTGVLYPIYLAGIVFFLVMIVYNFWTVYRMRRNDSTARLQVWYTAAGGLLGAVWIFVTSAILPLLTGDWNLSKLGILGPLFFAFFIAYAIVRHRMFDIRLIVARSVGYLLSIAFLAAFYGLIAFTLINRLLFHNATISGLQQLLYTLLAVIIAFTFPPIKKFFDRATNRVFYRDAYDPQQLLDNLNKTLVSTIELRTLLKRVADIISGTLKADYAMFDIKQPNGRTEHVVASPEGTHINRDELALIRKEAPTIRRKILLTDELEDHPRLQKVLRDNNIALIAHMVDSPKQDQAGLGYLLLGTKKSGNPYSSEDVRIMEIIADELVIAVQNALRFDEIKDFNITLQQKVEDATRKLRRTNEKLKQLDETKDDFISMASHQLRTPLTSVKGYVSMVLEGDAGKISTQQQKLLDQAFVSSQRMVFLIADLLNVSRLKTGKFIIEPKPTNLSEVVAGEIEQLVETAKGRDLTLTYHKPHDFPVLNLDETKTRQVIMNFVDNAIYYTPAGGHITVNLEDKPESIELTVVDDGLGVPKAEQPHLFTKFYRARNAKKARPDGTGLGLFMAKKVIIAQGGAVIFKSQEGKGSTFGFSFPKSKLLVK